MSVRYLIFSIMILALSAGAYGQKAKEFTLSSVTDDSKFNSAEARGKYVALHFLLKTECPYCIRHTHDYAAKASRLPEVVQVFVKPDNAEEIMAWSENLTEEELSAFPIYRDPEGALADAFNIPGGYHFHNQVIHYPALVLLDPKGNEVFRYVGENNRDRYSFESLEMKVRELEK